MDTTEHKDRPFIISVVIPAYNIGKLVARAIDSVLAQTHQPDEIIVVDDGSTDDTADIIKSYGSKVKYIYQANLGLAGARNTGIRAATCEWVAFLDGDDEWLPKNLELQLGILKRNPDLVWSAGNYENCLCNEDRRGPNLDPAKARKLMGGKDYFDDYFEAFMANAGGSGDSMIVKRSALGEVGLFREEMPCTEDTDMWFRLAMRWPRVGFVSEPIAVYHLHRPGSLIHDMATGQRQEVIYDMFERTIELARQHGRMEDFRPCLVFCLHRRIRSNLFEYKTAHLVREILIRFDQHLSVSYKMVIRLLAKFPRATAAVMHLISKTIRLFNLRKNVLRRPRK